MCRNSSSHAAAAVLAAISLALSAIPGRADQFKLIPTAGVKAEFNDNVFFATDSPRSSFISTLSGGVTLLDRTERLNTKFDARLDGLLYTASSDLDALEQRYAALAEYRMTPTFGIRGSADFDRQTRPDRLIETSGMVLTNTSYHQGYSIAADLTLTEKLSGVARYGYEAVDYDVATQSDVQRHDVTIGTVYDLGRLLPLLKTKGSLGYSKLSYSAVTVDNLSATVGISYQFHELWSLVSDVGGRFTHVDFVGTPPAAPETTAGRGSSDSPGLVANVSAYYKGEVDTATFTLSRDVQIGAGVSGAVDSTGITASLRRKFSAEASGSLWAGAFLNTSHNGELAAANINQRSFSINPTLRYEFFPEIFLDLSYAFALVEYRQKDRQAHRNRIFLSLTMQSPLLERH